MIIKSRVILIIQTIVILLLSILLFLSYSTNNDQSMEQDYSDKLLSPRIYANVLEPKSYLIVNYAPLKNSIEQYILSNKISASVYIENLRSGAFIGINERKAYHPASLNKVLTAMLISKKIEDDELSWDEMVNIDAFRSNYFGTLYQSKESKHSVRFLMGQMLQESDDSAFKTLNNLVDDDDYDLFISYLDYYSDDSLQKTKPGEDAQHGLITPKSMYNVFSSLYLSTLLDAQNSEYILTLLSNTSLDIKTIAQLPFDTKLAHKFGMKYDGKDQFFHDCGILYIKERRIFYCVMTQDMQKESAIQFSAVVVDAIYNYTVLTHETLDEYRDS